MPISLTWLIDCLSWVCLCVSLLPLRLPHPPGSLKLELCSLWQLPLRHLPLLAHLAPIPVVLIPGELNFGCLLLSCVGASAHHCHHHGCCTLREPVTKALTTHAFIRFCAHMSFASTLLQDQSTLWAQFEPHPPTAGPGLQARTGLSQSLLLTITQVRGIEGGIQSQIIYPR